MSSWLGAINRLRTALPLLAGHGGRLTMRSKSVALMYPVARAAWRRVVPSSLALCAMVEALS
jgi:hypothetical protein